MVRVKLGYEERGIASWYGHPYHGRATASGEIYDMERLTAAHQRLPFGVTTRVENLVNGKTVDVKINDRGPFVKGRIIDLSRAAAREIDLIGPGVARVRIKVIAAPAHVRAATDVGAKGPSERTGDRFAFLLRPLPGFLHRGRAPKRAEREAILTPSLAWDTGQPVEATVGPLVGPLPPHVN